MAWKSNRPPTAQAKPGKNKLDRAGPAVTTPPPPTTVRALEAAADSRSVQDPTVGRSLSSFPPSAPARLLDLVDFTVLLIKSGIEKEGGRLGRMKKIWCRWEQSWWIITLLLLQPLQVTVFAKSL